MEPLCIHLHLTSLRFFSGRQPVLDKESGEECHCMCHVLISWFAKYSNIFFKFCSVLIERICLTQSSLTSVRYAYPLQAFDSTDAWLWHENMAHKQCKSHSHTSQIRTSQFEIVDPFHGQFGNYAIQPRGPKCRKTDMVIILKISTGIVSFSFSSTAHPRASDRTQQDHVSEIPDDSQVVVEEVAPWLLTVWPIPHVRLTRLKDHLFQFVVVSLGYVQVIFRYQVMVDLIWFVFQLGIPGQTEYDLGVCWNSWGSRSRTQTIPAPGFYASWLQDDWFVCMSTTINKCKNITGPVLKLFFMATSINKSQNSVGPGSWDSRVQHWLGPLHRLRWQSTMVLGESVGDKPDKLPAPCSATAPPKNNVDQNSMN